MGSALSFITATALQLVFGSQFMDHDFQYAVFDPTQIQKPHGRSKDIISVKHRNNPQKLDTVINQGCDSLWKCFKRSVWRFPNRNFLGSRKQFIQGLNFRQNHNLSQDQNEYIWKSYQDVDDIVEAFSRSLEKKKLCKQLVSQVEGTPSMKIMGIFSENREEWMITELACCSNSIAVVPIQILNQFQNEDFTEQICQITEIQTVCVSMQTLGIILELKSRQKLSYLKNVIIYDHPEEVHLQLSQQLGLNLIYYEDMVKEGMREIDFKKSEPSMESVFFIGVTSGTTQQPKLVMLTHQNFISGQVSQQFLGYNFNEEDVYYSYVPLSHVQEQIGHIAAFTHGFSVGYGSGDIQNIIQDIQILKPTIFGSFPSFFNKLYTKINENIENQPKLLNTILTQIIQTKTWYYIKYGFIKNAIFDQLFLVMIRNILGGRMRIMFSGGAPLSPQVKNFISVVFSVYIFECYGCTETAGNLSCSAFWDRTGGHAGGNLGCNKMQLRDVQELNCLTDSERPSGEIYVKGNAVMLGYFKNPELTKQVIDEEGWFKVGDIGIMHKSGAIEIVERMNEVKKLQNGIFITPQRLESVYASAPLVEQIMVDVNSNFNFLVAVVTLNDEKLQQFIEVNGIDVDKENIDKSKDIEYGILKQLERTAIQNKLDPAEKIVRVHISKEKFSSKNGMLTNTQKLARSTIKNVFSNEIQNLYKQYQMFLQSNGKEGALGVN